MKNLFWSFENFGIENLKLKEEPLRELEDNEILIEMKAVSLNYRDLLMIEGKYNPKLKMPLVPCSDGAGVVIQTGRKVKTLKEGDRVQTLFSQNWFDGKPDKSLFRSTLGGPLMGTLQKYKILSEEGVVKTPENVNDLEAATLPCAALTAWSTLIEYGEVKPGETILTLGTGGVSIFALQFGKLMGASVIITSGSEEKLQRAKILGADFTINYKTHPDWEKEVLKITDMKGADHIIEVGGVGTLEKSIRSVKVAGNIYLIGVLTGRQNPVDLTPVLMQNIRIQGIIVGHKRSMLEMNKAISYSNLKPVIDKIFSFEKAPEAFEYLKSGSHFGKISIEI